MSDQDRLRRAHVPAQGWSDVLLKKRDWIQAQKEGAPSAPARRQIWADALEDFAEANPGHAPAREAHEQLVLEQARTLAERGRSDEASHLYESLLARRPSDPFLRTELAAVLERETVRPEELQAVRPGMSPKQVEEILGKAPPGWTRADGNLESWYYRRPDQGVASVFFRDGKVFAVEYEPSR
jgi:hypothetical protein